MAKLMLAFNIGMLLAFSFFAEQTTCCNYCKYENHDYDETNSYVGGRRGPATYRVCELKKV